MGGARSEAGEHGADAGAFCLNCRAVRAGPFCQQCGQNGHLHRNLVGLGHDLLHGVFHFEGKFWNTLPLLAWRPGEVTRRYVHGERAKFVTPMALFLFSVFLLFAAMNRLALPDASGAAASFSKASVETGKAEEQSARNLAKLEDARAARLKADPKADTAALDRQIKAEQNDVATMGNISRKLRLGARKSPGEAGGDLPAAIAERHSSFPWLDRQIRSVNENSALYAYKLKMASYKFSWALIPISLPFIWLLFFWRRDVGLYDHAIFAIHSLSFMTLLVVGLIGLDLVGVPQSWLWLVFLVAPPIHIYRHLKGAYRLGRFGAGWRTIMLLLFTGFAITLFALLLIWLEAE